ncbi:MAG: hypothetical protein AAFQ02_05950 [Bacteroidota bacterium]
MYRLLLISMSLLLASALVGQNIEFERPLDALRSKTVSYPAGSLASTSPLSGGGLNLNMDPSASAQLVIARPNDWDGTSTIQVSILFNGNQNPNGSVRFMLRPRMIIPGQGFVEADGITGTSALLNVPNERNTNTIMIPANRINPNAPWWNLVMIPDVSSSTYNGVVTIKSVSITYEALR